MEGGQTALRSYACVLHRGAGGLGIIVDYKTRDTPKQRVWVDGSVAGGCSRRQFSRHRNAFLMLLLQQGSPAQRCIPRIGVGDRILAINGNQASNF